MTALVWLVPFIDLLPCPPPPVFPFLPFLPLLHLLQLNSLPLSWDRLSFDLVDLCTGGTLKSPYNRFIGSHSLALIPLALVSQYPTLDCTTALNTSPQDTTVNHEREQEDWSV